MRKKNPADRIRELESELTRLRTAHEGQLTRFTAELESLRSQATARRAPATVFIGNLKQSDVNKKIRKRELGSFSDGGNMSLQIRAGAKPDSDVIASWLFRWTETLRPGVYKDHSMGLGSARLVPLEDARRNAHHFRELLAQGKDPKVEKLGELCEQQAAKGRMRTLEQVCEEYIEKKLSAVSPGYGQRIRQLLRDNILNKPYKLDEGRTVTVGSLPIQRVTRSIIMNDCGFEQFWSEQNPSAKDVQLKLDSIYCYAREKGYYVGNSPMAWRGGLEHVLPARKKVHTVKHHKALNHKNAPVFLQQHLRKHQYRRVWRIGTGPDGRSINSYMIELAMQTGARVSEIIAAEWQEINYGTMTWTVPPEHTKRNEPDCPHRMPITPSMLVIFKLMEQMRADPSPQAPIFPSHHKRWVQSHRRIGSQTLRRVIDQLAPGFGEEFTNHGFRSTLKDWWKPRHPMALYELQVHHKEPGKTKQAYGHDDLLEERRPIMEEWDRYLNTAPRPAKEADNVVTLSKRRKS